MQTYPALSTREQWRLLCWRMRHPRAFAEDTCAITVAPSLPAKGRRRKGLHGLLAHLLELPS